MLLLPYGMQETVSCMLVLAQVSYSSYGSGGWFLKRLVLRRWGIEVNVWFINRVDKVIWPLYRDSSV